MSWQYAKESGDGMSFGTGVNADSAADANPAGATPDESSPAPDRPKGKPSLRVVK